MFFKDKKNLKTFTKISSIGPNQNKSNKKSKSNRDQNQREKIDPEISTKN
jgi:hypothetical protein